MNDKMRTLDAARCRWLAELALTHQRMGTADTALKLARGYWLCGEYDAALDLFREAAERAPEQLESQISLIRCASMLGMRELEDDVLRVASARFPTIAELAVHAALRRVPDDLAGAIKLLAPFVRHSMAQLFHRALCEIADGSVPASLDFDVPQLAACWDSYRWMRRHAPVNAFVGLPIDVLERALSSMRAEGMVLECGVYFGRSLRIIAARASSQVHGFDSFEGLPEAWNANEPAGAYSTGGRLPSQMPANVVLHRGWFEQTLPNFFAAMPGEIRFLHIDCDLYSSTKTVLQHANPRLVPGSILLFDDFLGYPGYEQHELRAFEEFARDRNIGWEVVAGCLLGREVAIRVISC